MRLRYAVDQQHPRGPAVSVAQQFRTAVRPLGPIE